ncbi:MAG: hypothetical protein Q8O30_10075, partial [Candidatus Omnitrophota bacterium]|nr:hypothetical protein [Candidatus Omnitrophota bacterium]
QPQRPRFNSFTIRKEQYLINGFVRYRYKNKKNQGCGMPSLSRTALECGQNFARTKILPKENRYFKGRK